MATAGRRVVWLLGHHSPIVKLLSSLTQKPACAQKLLGGISGSYFTVYMCSADGWYWTDQKCDGKLDGGATFDGPEFSCAGYGPDGPFPACENQKGACAGAFKSPSLCQQGTWLPCTDAEYAAASAAYGVETCDGLDNDCDGQTDEELACSP